MKFKICYVILIVVFQICTVIGQTLFNGGYIPQYAQLKWTNAGLLEDATAIEPKALFAVPEMPGATDILKVNAAIDSANAFVDSTHGMAIIYFPENIYLLGSTIQLTSSDSNIVFQGDGADKTILRFISIPNYDCFSLAGSVSSSWFDLNQSILKGDSIIYAPPNGLNALGVNDWIHFIKHKFDYDEPPEYTPVNDIVGQVTLLENKGTAPSGDDYGEIKDAANMNYYDSAESEYSLKIRKITPIHNIGIEDLRIERYPESGLPTGDYYVYNIKISTAVNCWVRGVESYKPSRSHLSVVRSSHIEISGCYFHEAVDYCGGGWGYGVTIESSSTNCLIENNIFRYLRHALVAGAGSNCNVWSFNYSREQHYSGSGVDDITSRDLDLHAKYPFGHLFEHNVVEEIGADDAHGDNGPYNAFIRNQITN
jgi:hypothetical protein